MIFLLGIAFLFFVAVVAGIVTLIAIALTRRTRR